MNYRNFLSALSLIIISSFVQAQDSSTLLDLVCVKVVGQNMNIYQIILEPEMLSSIPEQPIPPTYTGEYFAIVKFVNQPNVEDVILYSGRKEYDLQAIDAFKFRFQSQQIGLDLVCERNETAHGGGGFSGSN